MSLLKVKEKIVQATEAEKDKLEPLRKSNQKETQFPIDSLPPLLKNAILGLHDKTQAPIAICAQSILGAVNLAVQGHANINLPFGQEVPISCFFFTIAESGERKSSCDKEALAGIEEHEKDLKEEYTKKIKNWQNANEAWEQQRKQILLDKKKYPSLTQKEKALEELGEQPKRPLTPLLICPDPTFEGLCKLMENGQPSLGIFSAEGGQFLGGYGMRDENKVRTAAALSDMWDGKTVKRVRKTDGTLVLSGRRLSMHLMGQPKIGSSFLSDVILKDQGFLSRILIVNPKSTIGSRLWHNLKEESLNDLRKFKDELNKILSTSLPLKENCLNELSPRTINLTDDAIILFYEFSDHIERELAPGGRLENIKGLANKLPEHAVRIASTLMLVDNIFALELNYNYLKSGIELVSFYANEALRLYEESATDPKIIKAENLIIWLQDGWEEEYISLPDIYQNRSSTPTKKDAIEVATILQNHGWLQKIDGGKEIKGSFRKQVWRIIKEFKYESIS